MAAGNLSFWLDAREMRELRAAARKRDLAVATVARALTLRYFGIEASERSAVGPYAEGTKGWRPPRQRGPS